VKKRDGFVSNSSSSSFIVAFKEKPQTKEELKKILFGDIEIHSFYDNFLTAEQAAKIIFNDFKEPIGEKEIIKELGCGWPQVEGDPIPEYPISDFNEPKEERFDRYERYRKEVEEWNTQATKKFMEESKGMQYFIFEYSDNDGSPYCALEHGGTFDNVPNIRVSKH